MFQVFRTIAALVAVLACLALPARAGTITNVSVTYGQGITLTDVGANGILKQAYGSSSTSVWFAGQIVLAADAGTLGVWCVDLLHEINLGGHYSYTTAPLVTDNAAGAHGVPSTALTAGQISDIAELAAFGNAVLQPFTSNTVSPTLAAAYTAAVAQLPASVLSQFTGNLAAFSAAIQAAIWNVEYDLTATGSQTFNNFLIQIASYQNAFSDIGGYVLEIVDSRGRQIQKQFVSAVPEPATLAVLGTSLLALGLLRRRRPDAA